MVALNILMQFAARDIGQLTERQDARVTGADVAVADGKFA